jgi:hypothetical protein
MQPEKWIDIGLGHYRFHWAHIEIHILHKQEKINYFQHMKQTNEINPKVWVNNTINQTF